jgi:hypothetical protein
LVCQKAQVTPYWASTDIRVKRGTKIDGKQHGEQNDSLDWFSSMVENWITIGFHQNTIGFLYFMVEKTVAS